MTVSSLAIWAGKQQKCFSVVFLFVPPLFYSSKFYLWSSVTSQEPLSRSDKFYIHWWYSKEYENSACDKQTGHKSCLSCCLSPELWSKQETIVKDLIGSLFFGCSISKVSLIERLCLIHDSSWIWHCIEFTSINVLKAKALALPFLHSLTTLYPVVSWNNFVSKPASSTVYIINKKKH